MLRVCSSAFVLATVLSASAFAQTPTPRATAAVSAEKAPLVNLNTATVADLERLPGIGAKVAARIVEYRTKKGPFRKPEELMNVQGIGEKSFLKLRAQLTVSTPPESSAR
jgi:competence protein ComEA